MSIQLSNQLPVTRLIRPGQFPGIVFRPDGGDDDKGDKGGADDKGDKDESDPLLKKVDMTQKELQALLDRRDANTAAKLEKKFKAEIEALKGAADSGKKKEDDKDQKAAKYSQEELQGLLGKKDEEYTGKVDALNKQIMSLMGDRRDNALISAATLHKAINPKVAAKLVSDSVQFNEDGQLVVIDEKGKERIDGKGNPMSVESLLEEFLTANPYLKQGANNNGGGSGTKNAQLPTGKDGKIDAVAALANAFRNGGKK